MQKQTTIGDTTRLQELHRRLRSGHKRHVQIALLGNSVAVTNNAATTATFIAKLRRSYPRVTFTFRKDQALGGFEPSHFFLCGVHSLESADLVLLQYESFASKQHGEALLRTILSLPTRPAVLAVIHCSANHWRHGSSSSSSSSDPHAQERLLFTHYNVPTIDACKAMSTLLDGSCAAEETTTTKWNAATLRSKWYTDHVHYKPHAMIAQGCHLSHLYTAVTSVDGEADDAAPAQLLPKPLAPSSESTPTFCHTAPAGSLQPRSTSGWVAMRGGKRNSKHWFGSSVPGSTLEYLTPRSDSVLLEYYKHHNLPMGRVSVTVDGGPSRVLDACCGAARCAWHGNGVNALVTLVEGAELKPHSLVITMLPRYNASPCARHGSVDQFSLLSIIGTRRGSSRTAARHATGSLADSWTSLLRSRAARARGEH